MGNMFADEISANKYLVTIKYCFAHCNIFPGYFKKDLKFKFYVGNI